MHGEARRRFKETVRANISRFGHHLTMVLGGPIPRYAYTIGRSNGDGAELLFAGGYAYTNDSAARILDAVASLGLAVTGEGCTVNVPVAGDFTFREVHPTWAEALAPGINDVLERAGTQVLQVIPDRDHSTPDVPNLASDLSSSAPQQGAWKWLVREWDLPVPENSVATTNLAALRGLPVTEAARWEQNLWELFSGAGPEVSAEDVRSVPVGTLLALDPTLMDVLELEVGNALWRESREVNWVPWGAE